MVDYMCNSKSNGAFGIKHCEAFNCTLLSKWGWNIVSGSIATLIEVLRFKYGDTKAKIMDPYLNYIISKMSLWWHDCWVALAPCGSEVKWFANGVSCKMGNGSDVDFWRDNWLGRDPLSKKFHALFSLCAR